MKYNTGEFYLIKRYNRELELNKFIGEIIQIKESNNCELKVYIFPEATKIGRQSYMGSNEVYCTNKEIFYQFSGVNESKIELIPFKRYRNLKLKNQQLGNDIFFYRQFYSFETNKFNPEKLSKECYCKNIFNPDLPYKQCICGNFFHIECFIKVKTNECWNENCHYNCNNFLDMSQTIQKLMNKPDMNYKQTNKKINDAENDNNKKNFFYNFEYNKIYLNKKTQRNNKEYIQNISNDHDLSLSKRSTSSKTIKNNDDNFADKSNKFKKEKSVVIIESINKNCENINRENGQKKIYDVLLEGYNMIDNNQVLKKQYEQSRKKISKSNLNTFSKQIENNLFFLYKSNPSSYRNFLQEFNRIRKDTKDLLFKIISGSYSPEQISNFKGDDFLSEEKKKEKQKQKMDQMEKMMIKDNNNNNNEIQFSMGKGNLLTEKEVFIEKDNNENQNENIDLNLNRLNSNEKILQKQKQFPGIKLFEINNLISMENPTNENIKLRLEQMLKHNLDINSINFLKEKRKNMLIKRAKIIVNQEKKNKNSLNDENIVKDEIKNNPEHINKINEYMDKISFSDMKIFLPA